MQSPEYAFPLQKTNHEGHGMFGRNFYVHVDMIRYQMAFKDAALLLPSQLVEDRSQDVANVSIQGFLTSFGNEYDMVLAMPTRMRQALIHI
jgi:hypothetical protein